MNPAVPDCAKFQEGGPKGCLADIFVMVNKYGEAEALKPVGKGAGLGISSSYNIMAKHHGSIKVRSAVGKGTTFRVWLPVEQPKITEQE